MSPTDRTDSWPKAGVANHPACRADSLRGRWLLLAGVALLLAAGLARAALVRGWLRPVRIAGPSMAPTFRGDSLIVPCRDCGFRFACDAERLPRDGRLCCPNCGQRDNELPAAKLASGERVLVDAAPYLAGRPQRWDVVAFRTAEGELAVKRVVGLPGERIQIRGGDIYAGGRIVRKSLAQLRDLAVLVHDDAWLPAAPLPARWQAAEGSPWRREGARHRGDFLALAADSPLAWLTYQQWRCTAALGPRDAPAPLTDNDAYNQAESRELNQVGDVLLSLQVRLSGPGELRLAASDGRDTLTAVFAPASRRVQVRRGDQVLAERPLLEDFSQPRRLEFALCDQQALVGLDGRELLAVPWEPSPGPRGANAQPFALEAPGLTVALGRLRVWRDVHYLEPHSTGRSWTADRPLHAQEYALLGDNPPVSIDSRHWPRYGVPRQDMLGRVVRW